MHPTKGLIFLVTALNIPPKHTKKYLQFTYILMFNCVLDPDRLNTDIGTHMNIFSALALL